MALTYPIPTVTAGEYIDTPDWNALADSINFLANRPACRVHNSANISVPNATDTILTFNTESFDTASMHSTSVNTGRITCTAAGIYVVTAVAQFAANATGARSMGLIVNGLAGTFYNFAQAPVNSAAGATRLVVTDIIKLAVGDHVQVVAYQTSGGALNVEAFGRSPSFSAVWIGLGT